MPGKNKASKIESLILRLLQEQQQQDVSIRSIARAAGVPENDATKRKAIRRALLSLEERKLIVPKGEGRSRVYTRLEQTPQPPPVQALAASEAASATEGGASSIQGHCALA